MKKKKENYLLYSIIIALVFIVFIMIISVNQENATISYNSNLLNLKDIFSFKQEFVDNETYLTIETVDEGYDVYVPSGKTYRYGPSIIYYEDGTMDAWFAANGNSKEWDWITYRHFDGQEWSKEEVVLRPTKNSLDHFSVCDPGVIYFDGYYYLGYTSTTNADNGGVENCGYVARSTKPNGPFEKWNGKGWGGKPSPIIVYDENDGEWGAGELSFVIVDDKLYCYYSWINKEGSYTKLAICELKEDWPLTMEDKGIVITKHDGQDSCDVVYDETHQKFLAFCVQSRFMNNSAIAVYESNDGMNFYQVDTVSDDINKYSHNMGISKMLNGHISEDDDLLIGYAYSKGSFTIWGKWATKFQKIKIKRIN